MKVMQCWALIGRNEITATPFDKMYFVNEYDAKQTVKETYSKIAEVKDDNNCLSVWQEGKKIAFFLVKREEIKIYNHFTHL